MQPRSSRRGRVGEKECGERERVLPSSSARGGIAARVDMKRGAAAQTEGANEPGPSSASRGNHGAAIEWQAGRAPEAPLGEKLNGEGRILRVHRAVEPARRRGRDVERERDCGRRRGVEHLGEHRAVPAAAVEGARLNAREIGTRSGGSERRRGGRTSPDPRRSVLARTTEARRLIRGSIRDTLLQGGAPGSPSRKDASDIVTARARHRPRARVSSPSTAPRSC